MDIDGNAHAVRDVSAEIDIEAGREAETIRTCSVRKGKGGPSSWMTPTTVALPDVRYWRRKFSPAHRSLGVCGRRRRDWRVASGDLPRRGPELCLVCGWRARNWLRRGEEAYWIRGPKFACQTLIPRPVLEERLRFHPDSAPLPRQHQCTWAVERAKRKTVSCSGQSPAGAKSHRRDGPEAGHALVSQTRPPDWG